MTENTGQGEAEIANLHFGKMETVSPSKGVFTGHFYMFTEMTGAKLIHGDLRKLLLMCHSKLCDFAK